ncbi:MULTISPECIES: SDR family NAD(P)-dependent oxidoreductase [unclassified Neorhizobium]|uniref:SDR family NAD(P)-dependent oxidoreductase n=1 Tax=unclassified Neorhizobium TaxID=2629175 RepID=UPI001FF64D5A|nr:MULTISPECIES: SDR family oxidoreductase [unclassified Neorhizobium]MCJ9669953.1 SDR family oxidoreductase [Neorhizobium sp. SHOUNA12B]MCJ9744770.1 SDR family oxidoreductase [Neorhizobium sp. SHOUNA12A]
MLRKPLSGAFARTWANDLRGQKIRVNALSPGFTLTPLMENGLHMGQAEIEALKDFAAREVPLGYMAEPVEIATAALFLASQDAKYVNGIELTVDGGLSQI